MSNSLANIVWILALFCCVFSIVLSAPLIRKTRGTDPTQREKTKAYLVRYGFLGENNPNATVRELERTNPDLAFIEALKNAQRMYADWNITVTGVMDEDTMEIMEKRRCGNLDMTEAMMMKRKKRYLLGDGTWNKNSLTWKVTQYPADGDLNKAQVDQEMERAFSIWAEVTPLRFTQLADADNTVPDIIILFAEPFIDHGDRNPFDGENGVLAHAFYPEQGPISGDSHFDEGETWTINSFQGINLFQVAAHEFGHALGLDHSMVNEALMAPFYQGYVPNFQLPTDDILGIQAKYGPPVPTTMVPPTTTTTTTPEPLDPDVREDMDDSGSVFCNSPSFDAITNVFIAEGTYRTFAFRGDTVYQLENSGAIAQGYPRPIDQVFPGLPNDIDDAVFWDAEYEYNWNYNYAEGQWEYIKQLALPPVTYVFKGDQYWVLNTAGVEQGNSDWGLPRNMGSIDAVYKWSYTGFTYFISGNQYWAYSEERNGFLTGYPRPLSLWGDFQGPVDTVFHSYVHDALIFSSGDQFYMFDDYSLSIADGYPQDIVPNLVICPESLLQRGGGGGGDDDVSGAVSCHHSLSITTMVIVFALVLSVFITSTI